MLHHVCRSHAGGDLAEDRDVDDFCTVEVFWKDDGPCLVRVALDDAFFLQRTQVAHGGSLAGEAEVALNVTRGGHDAVGALVAAQVIEKLLLAGREAGFSVDEHEERGLFVRTSHFTPDTQDVFLRRIQRIVTVMMLPNHLLFFMLLLLAAVVHAQEAAQLKPGKMDKTGMLPPFTKVLGERAAAAFGKQDWKAARKAYEEMLELDDGNALIWANLGAVEQQSGDLKRAIECFEKSVLINPQLAQTWTALGLLVQKQGDSYRAISCFARAIHEDPEDARAHNFLAIAAKGLGWTDAAEAELQRSIELKPDYGIAHFNMALMLLERRPPAVELARRHYEKALALGVTKDDVVERRLTE
jgi:Flp pilus assembly protein TadD